MKADPCDYVRRSYGVPAEIGGRVRFVESDQTVRYGVIVKATHHLHIRWDGDPKGAPLARLHPTWHVSYLGPCDCTIWPSQTSGGWR